MPILTMDKLLDTELEKEELDNLQQNSIYGFKEKETSKSTSLCDINEDEEETISIANYRIDVNEIDKLQTKIKDTFHFPTEHKKYTSFFGYRENPFGTGGYEFHTGIDIAGEGSIFSVLDGKVVKVGYDPYGYGYYMDIEHSYNKTEKITTRYAHFRRMDVKENDIVTKGQIIGLMGSTGRSTGTHLHFEVIKDGKRVDPKPYLDNSN